MMKKEFPYVQTQTLMLSAVTGERQFSHCHHHSDRTDRGPHEHSHQPGDLLRTSSESDFNTENFRANQVIEAELEDFIVLFFFFLKIF